MNNGQASKVNDRLRILLLEPFFGGSHRRFCETLMSSIDADWTALTMPDRHWKWRARGCVLYWHESHSDRLEAKYDLIFTSSLVPICELRTLSPSLAQTPLIVYCHENQFTYPNQTEQARDHHYGFTEMVNFRAADMVVFNSEFNRRSFFENAGLFLHRMPDYVPSTLLQQIEAKSKVIPLVLDWPVMEVEPTRVFHPDGPLIMWNHRWEHDKGPEAFFEALFELKSLGHGFRLSLCGQKFRKVPRCFEEAQDRLHEHIVDAVPISSRAGYLTRLAETDIVVSTANHEFFGISVLEATLSDAVPVVPDRLVYPDLYPDEFRYTDQKDLVHMLENLCARYASHHSLRRDRNVHFRAYLKAAEDQFKSLFERLANGT